MKNMKLVLIAVILSSISGCSIADSIRAYDAEHEAYCEKHPNKRSCHNINNKKEEK